MDRLTVIKNYALVLFVKLRDSLVTIINNDVELEIGLKIFIAYLSFVVLGWFFNFFFVRNFIFLGEFIKKRFMRSFFWGVVVIPCLIILPLALAGTTVGILLLPALLFLYLFFALFCFYTVALVLGEKILKLFTYKDYPNFELWVGVTALFLIALIPYLGLGIFLVALMAGLGAVAKLKFGVR